MSYVLAFAGFAALVILHELGHFAAAKAVGMRVERFSLFFPPLIFRWRKQGSETEYAIGAIPLGGYVKITGMNPEEDIPADVVERAYYRQKVWKRVVVIAAGPAVNIVLAFVILWGLYTFSTLNFAQPVVDKLTPSSPAAQVLRPGDRVLSVDGKPGYAAALRPQDGPDRVNSLMSAIVAHTCSGKPVVGCESRTPVRFEVLRGAKHLSFRVFPRFTQPPPPTKAEVKEGATPEKPRMLVGLQFGDRTSDFGPAGAAGYAGSTMWKITTTTVDSLVKLVYDKQARKQVSGVVGSYEATRESFAFDTKQAIYILALISLSLGVINLFPFLPLDGGHIFWALAEKLRGRPIPFRVMERAGIVGFMLVFVLFYIGLSNDIGRISSGQGFGVR
ncbi:MAG TPA: M50 family metallopeptidase [Solirubrobacteraceae bacterium]|nr:M50 family metallopeptidase [Solirubrobacteraceae bacterium]